MLSRLLLVILSACRHRSP